MLRSRGRYLAKQRSRGTGPRATGRGPLCIVGRGPVPRHAAFAREVPRQTTIAGDRHPRYGARAPLYRRAWALGCHTRMRAGSPRHATIAREVPRQTTIAGDRPPRYGTRAPSVPRHAYHLPNLSNNESCMGLPVHGLDKAGSCNCARFA